MSEGGRRRVRAGGEAAGSARPGPALPPRSRRLAAEPGGAGAGKGGRALSPFLSAPGGRSPPPRRGRAVLWGGFREGEPPAVLRAVRAGAVPKGSLRRGAGRTGLLNFKTGLLQHSYLLAELSWIYLRVVRNYFE